jgi:hypothetical protein
MLTKIISGGQTGADIAAIDAAIKANFPYGGMLPKGRMCESGTVPLSYSGFDEAIIYGYHFRTEQNIKNSDGTLIFSKGKPTGGTDLTIGLAGKNKKPYLVIDINQDKSIGFGVGVLPISLAIDKFIRDNNIKILNVAGPRESKTPGMYQFVYLTISDLLT